jgi:hypothetical protein
MRVQLVLGWENNMTPRESRDMPWIIAAILVVGLVAGVGLIFRLLS